MSINSKFTINDVLLNQESLQKKNKYSCPICFEYFYKKSIFQCRSGHYACEECWKKSLETKQECMICRSEVYSFNDLSRCLVIEQDFGKKECYCIYSFHNDDYIDVSANEKEKIKDEESGCKEIMNVDQLFTHIENCKFKFVKCSHNGCDEVLRLNSLEEHENQCDFKLVTCDYCACDDIIFKELTNHYDECPKFKINCPQGCLEYLERDEIESHLDNDCHNTTIPCKYYEYGCKVEMKRSELQNHLNSVNHQISMGLLIDKLSSTLAESNKTQDQLFEKIEQSEKIQEKLLQEINELQKYSNSPTYNNKWIISNFSNINNSATSPPFNFEKQEFRIVLTISPFLGNEIFIRLNAHQALFHFKYICTLVNSNRSNSIEFKGTHNSFCPSICKLYFFDIINRNNGWLQFDQLKIKIKIKKINYKPPLES
ncbi:hypothetical protein ACTFIT_001777 [Dictyostelium discoideum]